MFSTLNSFFVFVKFEDIRFPGLYAHNVYMCMYMQISNFDINL